MQISCKIKKPNYIFTFPNFTILFFNEERRVRPPCGGVGSGALMEGRVPLTGLPLGSCPQALCGTVAIPPGCPGTTLIACLHKGQLSNENSKSKRANEFYFFATKSIDFIKMS